MASMSKKDRYPLSSSSRRDIEKERAAATVVTERLKTVVRRLPASLPEEVFWQSVQQWVTDETVLWKVFYPGKLKKRINKENIPSRAYIAFKNEEFVAQFSKEYDGHIFRDKQGNESQAVVEFAPYQKIPPDKKKIDARNATIEKDEDYISFIDSLNQAEKEEPVSIETLIAANQPPPMPKTTPLLEALKAEKSSKDKDSILRTHAQYKNATILQSSSLPRNLAAVLASKDDPSGKKKAAQPPPPSLAKDSAQPDSGKKGKKAQAATTKQPQGSQIQPTHVSHATKKEPPPFKPHKLARQQAAAAKVAAAATQAQTSSQRKAEEVLPVSASSSGDGSTPIAPGTGGVVAQVSAAAAASRRGRPVVGLASRQLQAALSQVGASAMERKRREREAEKGTSPVSPEGVGNSLPIVAEGTSGKGKEPERAIISATSGVTSPPSPETSNASGKETRERPRQTPPTSPRHDRTRRRDKSGYQADPGVKVPSIMQRPEGIPPPASQRDAPSQVLPSAVQVQAQISPLGGPGTGVPNSPPLRSGTRRGRGRGRGQRGG